MWKRFLPIAAALVFAFTVLFVSLEQATLGVRPSFAAAKKVLPTPTIQPTVTPTPKIDYFFAYPGILPDNPLYKIKMVRDQLRAWLTTDLANRANLFLLYADKRVGAGRVLIEGNKVNLGLSTLVKGEKYLEKSIAEVEKLKARGVSAEELKGKLRKASKSHEVVLLELREKLNGEGKIALDNLIKFSKSLQERIEKI